MVELHLILASAAAGGHPATALVSVHAHRHAELIENKEVLSINDGVGCTALGEMAGLERAAE